MTEATTKLAFNLVHRTGKTIDREQFLFACRGNFNSSITDNILFLTEGNLLGLDNPKIAKKVYYLMVEGLQNITRHQQYKHSGDAYEGGLFIINRREEAYSITYGNWVSTEVRSVLEDRLATIQTKDSDELKEYYMQILNNSGFSDKGGAGLGLVDMARKSSGKLSYKFVPINNGFFYYLNLTIAIDADQHSQQDADIYLNEAVHLHNEMIEADAQILFKGLLNEDNVNHLSNQIDTTVNDDPESKGLGVVMTELLRNVAKHAYNRFNQSGKPGVFMLQRVPSGYCMISGNYVHEHKVETVNSAVNAINILTTEDLNTYLEDRVAVKNQGQGFLQLRKISGHSFEHEIITEPEEPPYFILQIQLSR
ncbi:MAG: SiaB family protein kinase [Flavobacteriales bacterium]